MLIMYFCYQSENAYICCVIVFDKQVTLYSRLFVCFFFVWWVVSALSALWTDSRIRRWFSIIRLLFIHAFTFYRALLQLIEATNIARRSWTAGGRQSTKSERPSRALACLTERVIWTLQPGYRDESGMNGVVLYFLHPKHAGRKPQVRRAMWLVLLLRNQTRTQSLFKCFWGERIRFRRARNLLRNHMPLVQRLKI